MNKEYNTVKDILYTKLLNCYPPENQAAKLFATFLKEHPEYNINDIDCEIQEIKEEEDHYGNGGGYKRTLYIFRNRKETEEEYKTRIKINEDLIITNYTKAMQNVLSGLKSDVSKYLPDKTRVYNEIKDFVSRELNK